MTPKKSRANRVCRPSWTSGAGQGGQGGQGSAGGIGAARGPAALAGDGSGWDSDGFSVSVIPHLNGTISPGTIRQNAGFGKAKKATYAEEGGILSPKNKEHRRDA
jgi:hypothetical protein